MRIATPLMVAFSLGALARAAPAQQPKTIPPPVVAQPLKPVPAPVLKTSPAPAPAPAKSTARKYPVVINTSALDVEISAKPSAPGSFKPLTYTTATLDVELSAPSAPPPLPPFTPRSIKTDSLSVVLTHP